MGLIVLNRPVNKARTAALPPPGIILKARPFPTGRRVGAYQIRRSGQQAVAHARSEAAVKKFDTKEGTWDTRFICAGTTKTRVGAGDSGEPLFDPKASGASGKTVVYGLVTGETNTCSGLFTNLADPAIWKPFRAPLASYGLGHLIPT